MKNINRRGSLVFDAHVSLICGQLQAFQIEDVKQDYDTGRDGYAMLTFRVDHDKLDGLEESISTDFRNDITLYKR